MYVIILKESEFLLIDQPQLCFTFVLLVIIDTVSFCEGRSHRLLLKKKRTTAMKIRADLTYFL